MRGGGVSPVVVWLYQVALSWLKLSHTDTVVKSIWTC